MDDERVTTIRREAAALAFGLGCEEPQDKALARRVPDSDVRETELLAALERGQASSVPSWLADVSHRLSRHTLLAALAAAAAYREE